jgi:hypothetical protein
MPRCQPSRELCFWNAAGQVLAYDAVWYQDHAEQPSPDSPARPLEFQLFFVGTPPVAALLESFPYGTPYLGRVDQKLYQFAAVGVAWPPRRPSVPDQYRLDLRSYGAPWPYLPEALGLELALLSDPEVAPILADWYEERGHWERAELLRRRDAAPGASLPALGEGPGLGQAEGAP